MYCRQLHATWIAKSPDQAEIVEQIVIALSRPLRHHRSKANAYAALEMAIKMLRVVYGRPRPDAGSVRKAAKNLHKALEPLSGGMPIFLEGCDRTYMQLREFRSALDWLESTDGPSPKFDESKYLAVLFAYSLVNEFSQKPPTGTSSPDGQLRWADVDLDKRELHVRQRVDKRNMVGPPKSSSGERTVPLPPIVANTLKEHRLASKAHDGLVFPTGAGNAEYYGNIVKRGLVPGWIAAGIVTADGGAKYTGLHALRHFKPMGPSSLLKKPWLWLI